jgi:predicted permease
VSDVVANFWRVLVNALRRLRMEWQFSTAFVVTLALCLAANAAVFSAIDAYALRPLPYPQSGRLLNIYFNLRKHGVTNGIISVPAYERFRKLPAIADAGLVGPGDLATVIVRNELPETLSVAHVTSSVFTTIGLRPVLGRWLAAGADRPQGPREVVLSYGLWRSAFSGKTQALGESLRVNGKQYSIVGVMSRGFDFPGRNTALWVPYVIPPGDRELDRLTNWNSVMIARPRDGVSHTALQAELNLAVIRLEQGASPLGHTQLQAAGAFAAAVSWRNFMAHGTLRHLVIMQCGAGILLLLGVASLLNLAIIRALRRRQVLAVHVALGAEHAQLLLMALCEALPLAAVATFLAWPLGHLGAEAFTWFGVASQGTPFHLVEGPSVWSVAFALALLLSSVVLAMPQALLRCHEPGRLLQGGSRDIQGGRATLYVRQGLSVTQIGIATALLAMALLLGLSVRRMLHPHDGMRSDNLSVASLLLKGPAYRQPGAYYAAQRELSDAASRIPGVTAVGVGEGVPFTASTAAGFLPLDKEGTGPMASVTLVGAGLLRTLGVHLLVGRLITSEDISSNAPVIVIDRRYAQALFGTTDVVGRIVISNGVRWRIIGVVETIPDQFAARYTWTQGTVFLPAAPKAVNIWGGGGVMAILIRSVRPLSQLRHEFLVAMHRRLPDQALIGFSSMKRLIAVSAQGTTAVASLVIASGLLAFVLATVGTYGVVAYAAGLRRREFAIRQVLGATAVDIRQIVINQGLFLWGIGAASGVFLAILLAPLLRGELYEIGDLNVEAYLVPVIALGSAVALASWLAVRGQGKVGLHGLLQAE